MTTIQELAGAAYGQFETRQRGDDTIITLRDDAPDWLGELVHDAHGDMLPDDWRYATIRAALGFIHDATTDGEDIHDATHEFADGNVDIYNGQRTAWLASNLNRAAYCDDALDEFGIGDGSRGVFDLIGLGQYQESLEVFGSVAHSLQERYDELEDEAA